MESGSGVYSQSRHAHRQASILDSSTDKLSRRCMLPKPIAAKSSLSLSSSTIYPFDRLSNEPLYSKNNDTLKIHWKDFRKQTSLVGSNHQVSYLPPVGTKFADGAIAQYDQIWDHVKGKSTFKIDQILQTFAYGREDMAMYALHECDYNVNSTSDNENNPINKLMYLISNRDNDVSDEFWEEGRNKIIFHWSLLYCMKSKDFSALASKLGTTVNRCLIYYYNTFKRHDDYKKFKLLLNKRHRETKKGIFTGSYTEYSDTDSDSESRATDSDEEGYSTTCHYCDDVGHLIFCDGCERGYHLSCLKPPLSFADIEKIDKWYCNEFCTSNNMHERSSANDRNINRTRRRPNSTAFYSP